LIELRTLGPIGLRADDGRSVGSVLAQEKRLALLVYLAASRPGEFCRRDRVLGVFWPEADEARARNSLNQALHQLRRSLGEQVLVSRGDEVGVDPERVWCDVAAFRDALAAGDAAGALELYRGPFLDGFAGLADTPEWERWMEAERVRLARAAAGALRTVAAARASRQVTRRARTPPGRGSPSSTRSMPAPCSPGSARWPDSGDRAGALREADAFQARLREELDAAPDAEIAQFAARLRERVSVQCRARRAARRCGSGIGHRARRRRDPAGTHAADITDVGLGLDAAPGAGAPHPSDPADRQGHGAGGDPRDDGAGWGTPVDADRDRRGGEDAARAGGGAHGRAGTWRRRGVRPARARHRIVAGDARGGRGARSPGVRCASAGGGGRRVDPRASRDAGARQPRARRRLRARDRGAARGRAATADPGHQPGHVADLRGAGVPARAARRARATRRPTCTLSRTDRRATRTRSRIPRRFSATAPSSCSWPVREPCNPASR
jgi:hypothetical protein